MNQKQTQFKKAKTQALKVLLKDIEKYNSEYSWKSYGKIQTLESFPDVKTDLRGIDVTAKAKLLKKYLEVSFPENKFSVKIERYAGGSSIDATYKGDRIPQDELRQIELIYQDAGNSDMQSDYFDYDNYCSITENIDQKLARLKRCPKCTCCGNQDEKIAKDGSGNIICEWCFNYSRQNQSFQELPHYVTDEELNEVVDN